MTTQQQTLDQITEGQRAVVRGINGEGPIRRRMMDMGITRGVEIERVKAAPMGDPIEFVVRGYHLSLRRDEAQRIEVEVQ